VSRLPTTTSEPVKPPRDGSLLVASGILVSRVAGFVRLRVFAHFFGLSDVADAFNAAIRIPNFLQNLLGEGALSASFIPVYAALVAGGARRDADRVAGAILSLIALAAAVCVAVGLAFTPAIVTAIAPGFTGDKRALTITLVRILFPGAALLVLSAWCLGVLNSHHKFMLSYAAPVVWNATMIATLIVFGPGTALPDLAVLLAWGSVAGSALQVAVQVPAVLTSAPDLRVAFDFVSTHVRTVLRNFVPVLVSRGVVQVSAFIDSLLASLLPTGAVTGLANAQLLYTLPVSIFGMSVAAAELPAMAGVASAHDVLRDRLQAGLRRIAFFVVPSAMLFLALGDVVAAALMQTGRFGPDDAKYVWGILAGSAVGLLASTLGRLYSSAYYALHDTRTPLKCALVRVGLTTVLGYLFAFPLPRLLGLGALWGAAGLTASAGLAGWAELLLLRRGINRRIGRTGLPVSFLAKLWIATALAAAVAWTIRIFTPPLHPVATGVIVLTPYAISFAVLVLAFRIPEARLLLRRPKGV
jgi:putative peptidoglycan lipid II flippase